MTSNTFTSPYPNHFFISFTKRWFPVFFILHVLYSPNDCIPYTDVISNLYLPALRQPVAWFAKNMMHLPGNLSFENTGSSDKLSDYLVLLFCALLSTLMALIWAWVDRRDLAFQRFTYWFWAIIRYYLAFNMVAYGFAKIIKVQFPSLSPYRLVEPFGAASPMGLVSMV